MHFDFIQNFRNTPGVGGYRKQTEHPSVRRLNRELLRKEDFLAFFWKLRPGSLVELCWNEQFIDAYPSPDQIVDNLFAKGRIRPGRSLPAVAGVDLRPNLCEVHTPRNFQK